MSENTPNQTPQPSFNPDLVDETLRKMGLKPELAPDASALRFVPRERSADEDTSLSEIAVVGEDTEEEPQDSGVLPEQDLFPAPFYISYRGLVKYARARNLGDAAHGAWDALKLQDARHLKPSTVPGAEPYILRRGREEDRPIPTLNAMLLPDLLENLHRARLELGDRQGTEYALGQLIAQKSILLLDSYSNEFIRNDLAERVPLSSERDLAGMVPESFYESPAETPAVPETKETPKDVYIAYSEMVDYYRLTRNPRTAHDTSSIAVNNIWTALYDARKDLFDGASRPVDVAISQNAITYEEIPLQSSARYTQPLNVTKLAEAITEVNTALQNYPKSMGKTARTKATRKTRRAYVGVGYDIAFEFLEGFVTHRLGLESEEVETEALNLPQPEK